MKNPAARLLAGPNQVDGQVEAGNPENGLTNVHAPGDPGLTGQVDQDWGAVAPIRFKRDEPGSTGHLFGNFSD